MPHSHTYHELFGCCKCFHMFIITKQNFTISSYVKNNCQCTRPLMFILNKGDFAFSIRACGLHI